MDRIFDPLARFAIRHDQTLSIAAIVWLILSCAVSARFIYFADWLRIPYITDENAWAFSGAWNGLWWGFIHPALNKRREALKQEAGSKESEA